MYQYAPSAIIEKKRMIDGRGGGGSERERDTAKKNHDRRARQLRSCCLNGKKSFADFVSLSPANSKSTREANEVEEIVLVRSGSPRTVSDPQGWGVQ